MNPIASTPRNIVRAGFNTITLTDCCATTSAEGQAGATGGTFGRAPAPNTRVAAMARSALTLSFPRRMFSDPMTADDFVAKL